MKRIGIYIIGMTLAVLLASCMGESGYWETYGAQAGVVRLVPEKIIRLRDGSGITSEAFQNQAAEEEDCCLVDFRLNWGDLDHKEQQEWAEEKEIHDATIVSYTPVPRWELLTVPDTAEVRRDETFPTVDPADPYALTPVEREVMDRLVLEFAHSEKLQRHVQFLYSAGGMYLRCNGNLLYHGCIPMEEDGTFAPIPVPGRGALCGRAGIEAADLLARQGYFATLGSSVRQDGQDFLWYLGSGPNSPVFGKAKMATFERYFVRDKATHVEKKNAYYDFQDDEATALRILREFDLSENGLIINGHVPVKLGQGESPIKAGGKLLVIDGGLSRAYQPVTGIAGYTLIFTSHEVDLVAHQPFESTASAISAEQDIHSVQSLVRSMPRRLLIADTDDGEALRGRIDDLMALIAAYRSGVIKEMRG